MPSYSHYKNTPFFLSVIAILMALFIAFGLHHLGKFHTADEDLWFADPSSGRIHTYWKALSSGDWEKTLINDKPGVSTAFFAGPGLWFDRDPSKKVIEKADHYRISDPVVNERAAFFFRLPILLVSVFLLLVITLLVEKITGRLTALFFAIFAFLSPVFIGMSQIVNPDSLLWSSLFIALLSYYLMVHKEQSRYLIFAFIAAGFALLSKYTAVFLLIFLLFFHIAYVLFYSRSQNAHEWNKEIRKAMRSYFLFLIGTFAVFSLFLPAVFVDPTLLYKNTFGFENSKNIPLIITVLSIGFGGLFAETYIFKNTWLFSLMPKIQRILRPLFLFGLGVLMGLCGIALLNWTFHDLFDLPNVTFDNERGHQFQEQNFVMKFLYEVRPMVFTLTPVVLFFVFFAMIYWFRKSKEILKNPLIPTLLSFILLFYLAVVLQRLLLDIRYGIILYPAYTLIAALGATYLYQYITKQWGKRFSHHLLFLGMVVILFLMSLGSLFASVPFYFNYTNRLLPLENSVTTAWGYGGYEAAQVLNALPHAEELTAWTDYEGFCNFFLGKCIKGTGIKHYNDGTYQGIDFYVVSRRGKQIQKKRWEGAKDRNAVEEEPFWELNILGRESNYIRIHRGKYPTPQEDIAE